MDYNKGDNIKVQIGNITDIGAFVKLKRKGFWYDTLFRSTMWVWSNW